MHNLEEEDDLARHSRKYAGTKFKEADRASPRWARLSV